MTTHKVIMSGVIPTMQYPTIIIERFWEKVETSGDCWLWTASTRKGYGQLRINSKRVDDAHLISYRIHKGDISEGVDIDHECRVTSCVNPAHLRAVTHKQNLENRGPQHDSRSGIRGVSWNKAKGKWGVFVGHYSKVHFGGWFTELDAAEVAAIRLRNELHTHNTLDRVG